jgi:GNAT superfamily N-acetyltransferase
LREEPFLEVLHGDVPVGAFALTAYPDHILLDNFYLLPDRQRRGLGTRIVRHCLSVADWMGLPMRLPYLKLAAPRLPLQTRGISAGW